MATPPPTRQLANYLANDPPRPRQTRQDQPITAVPRKVGIKLRLLCFDDGRLALDNNPAERALRGVAIGRKNYLFAGSDAGGRRAAVMYSLIETAKLNSINPQHYLADVLSRIADHPARQIAELLPWNWHPAQAQRAAA